MLLTVTTTHRPATDLGFLLHKHPARVQSFPLPFGAARVFYPEATEERCTAALLLDVDPVGLVRRGRGVNNFALAEYVNDRPYVASSFLSVALVNVYKSAMAGTCKGHEELAQTPIPLEAWLPVVPARGGEPLVQRLFEPLGYAVEATTGGSRPGVGCGRSRLTWRSSALRDLLNHLYVLVPVLDDDKHYWVDEDEIEKLMRRGEGWLAAHPGARADRPPLPAQAGAAVLPRARAARRPRPRRAEEPRHARSSSRSACAARSAARCGRGGAEGVRRATRARPRMRRAARCSSGCCADDYELSSAPTSRCARSSRRRGV